jgi:hypothetical protein
VDECHVSPWQQVHEQIGGVKENVSNIERMLDNLVGRCRLPLSNPC